MGSSFPFKLVCDLVAQIEFFASFVGFGVGFFLFCFYFNKNHLVVSWITQSLNFRKVTDCMEAR